MIAICTPIYDRPDPRFVHCRMGTMMQLDGCLLLETHGKLLDDARTELTAQALGQPEVTHLAWIDDDMVFTKDALPRLLSHGREIVSGLCFERRPPYQATFRVDGRCYIDELGGDGLAEVDTVGAGFLLTARSVYEDIGAVFGPRSWWHSMPVDGGLNLLAGDESFLRRAKEVGRKVYVDVKCKIGHVARVIVDEDFSKMWNWKGLHT